MGQITWEEWYRWMGLRINEGSTYTHEAKSRRRLHEKGRNTE